MLASRHSLVICAIAPLLAVSAAVFGQDQANDPVAAPKHQQPRAACAASEQIIAALEQPGSWDLVDIPLQDVANLLADQLDIRVMVDRRALEDVGLGWDASVSLTISNVQARSMLAHLLDQLDLTWTVRNQMLVITTPEEEENELITCVYPLDQLTQDGRTRAEDIVRVVVNAVETDSWELLGGPGSIEPFKNTLVISQTWRVHEQVQALLSALRQLPLDDKEQTQQTVIHLDAVSSPARAALDEPVTLDLIEAPLADVLRVLQDQRDGQFLIDQRALEDVGLDSGTPVDFNAQGLPLREALDAMLRDLDLTWQVRAEVIEVTTPEEAENDLEVRIYPVASLVKSSGDVYAVGAALGELISVIVGSIEQESWEELGGPGSIEPLVSPPALVIAQTEATHHRIEQLLTNVRKTASAGDKEAETKAALRLEVFHVQIAQSKELKNLIQRVVAPLTWQDQDVLLEVIDNQLVVRQRPAVIAEVRDFLRQLEVLIPADPAAGGGAMGGFGGGSGFGGAPMHGGGGYGGFGSGGFGGFGGD